MTKADIIEAVYDKLGGLSKREAAELVELVFDTLKNTLASQEKVKISGFGNFVVREKKPAWAAIRRPKSRSRSRRAAC